MLRFYYLTVQAITFHVPNPNASAKDVHRRQSEKDFGEPEIRARADPFGYELVGDETAEDAGGVGDA